MELFATGNALVLAKLNKLHWTIAESITAVGNVGAGEDDLISLTATAATLTVDGDGMVFESSGRLAANANNKSLSLYIGGTIFSNFYSAAGNDLPWFTRVTIRRLTSTTAIVAGHAVVGNATVYVSFSTSHSVTWANACIVKITGTATADNDITNTQASLVALPGV